MAIAGLVIIAGCNKTGDLPAGSEGKIIVVATIFPLADWARQIGGDRVHVETLIPPGASPHTFDPTPRDMRLVSKSSVFLRVGLQMDDWGAKLANARKDDRNVVSVGDALMSDAKLPDVSHFDNHAEDIAHDHGSDDHAHDHGNLNPHFWLDPHLAIASIAIIKDAMTAADPGGKEIYEKNSAEYLLKLQALDSEISQLLEPVAGKQFVSFHNAWPYLAYRYHLKIAGVIEEYAGKSPGEKYLRTVTERLKRLGIKTIFSEPQLNPQVARVIADEVGGTVGILDPYGTEGSKDRGSYIDTMKYNTRELATALAK